MREPLIHSHITDELPEDHPLAWTQVHCDGLLSVEWIQGPAGPPRRCGCLLHAFNNECMITWVETGKGNYCLPCFVGEARTSGNREGEVFYVLEEEWAL